jgi:hypothetical protein
VGELIEAVSGQTGQTGQQATVQPTAGTPLAAILAQFGHSPPQAAEARPSGNCPSGHAESPAVVRLPEEWDAARAAEVVAEVDRVIARKTAQAEAPIPSHGASCLPTTGS